MRPKGLKLEARMAEARSGVLGRGAVRPPPHQLEGLGDSVAEIKFCVFLIPQKASTWGLTAFGGKNSGEARPIACPRAINSEEARTSMPDRLRHLWL